MMLKKSKGYMFDYNKIDKLFYDHVSRVWTNLIKINPVLQEQYDQFNSYSVDELKSYIEEVHLLDAAEGRNQVVIYGDPKVEKTLDTPDKKWYREYHADFGHYDDKFKDIKSILPVGITDEILYQAISDYREKHKDESTAARDISFNVEISKALLHMIIVKLSQYNTFVHTRAANFHGNAGAFGREKAGYVQCLSDEMRVLCTPRYNEHLKALLEAGIISCDGVYCNLGPMKKALSYKIADKFFVPDENGKIHKREEYKTYQVKYAMVNYKVQYRENHVIANAFNQEMIDDVKAVFESINVDKLEEHYTQNPHEFYGLRKGQKALLKKTIAAPNEYKLHDLTTTIRAIQDGDYYFNCSDAFGGRFHSPFTNLKSQMRGFIEYGDTQYINVDIKNSQMVILSAMIEKPDVAREILSGVVFSTERDGMTEELMSSVEFASQLEGVQDFIDQTKQGEIYEELAEYLGKDRKYAKRKLLGVIFSNEDQFKSIRAKIRAKYPAIVKLADDLNEVGGTHYLPKMCQRFESELFINRIVKAFFKVKKHPAITIHDSIMLHPEDLETFKTIYYTTFEELGLDPFLIREETY